MLDAYPLLNCRNDAIIMNQVNHHPKLDMVYAKPQVAVEPFSFNEQVAEVFPDMIERSVPGYQTMLSMLGHLTQKFSKPNAHYYDLGCSLGAATLAMRQNINAPNGCIYAIDNSPYMLNRCMQHVQAYTYPTTVKFLQEDILQSTIENAAMVVLNFTLQFLAPDQRQDLMNSIYSGLLPGGLLFLSEKIAVHHTEMQALINATHHDFKRRNGYSDLEISQKRSALEKVLRPDTLETHYRRLQNAGFQAYNSWYQQLNFCSFIAIKPM